MAIGKKTNLKNKDVNDPNTLTGRNIYKDDKGRVIYYRERIMTGYVIKAENVTKYRQFSSRLLYGLLAAILTATFLSEMKLPIWIGIIIGVAFWGLLSMRFYTKFLPSLIQIKNFIPTEKASMIQSLARSPRIRLILKSILLVVFAILLVINVIQYEEAEMMMVIASGVAVCGALIYAGVILVALRYQIKEEKK